MILVFGGTTEGRKAVSVLEEAGSLFYYSTIGDTQEVRLTHGKRLEGVMTEADIINFCNANGIKLIVDAAHPFAQKLHCSVASVASRLNMPAIRFDRIYPKLQEEDIIWCSDYSDAVQRIRQSGVTTIVTTTGVKSIRHLKVLEYSGIRCYYRILDRNDSREIAIVEGVDKDKILYYSPSSMERQLKEVGADAIIMKESGETGGFVEKVNISRKLCLTIFVVRRPQIHEIFHKVNGEHGLRLMVERLLPSFFPLHSGITTGTCATAAAVAELLRQTTVPVVLPNGETIMVDAELHNGYASVIKHSGDDPDVTDGVEITANIKVLSNRDYIKIKGGRGVGIITFDGFDFPKGEPAINKVPREMIRNNLRLYTDKALEVTIAVPDGERLASKTFNPRLGIVGGISIIGVSGIVKPFSEKSFIESIKKCLHIAKATGKDEVVINSGAKSERYLKDRFPSLPPQSFVEYGNYIGETIRAAADIGFQTVYLGVMLGKAVKLAAGNIDTHSKRATMDRPFIAQMLREAGISAAILSGITLARELWKQMPPQSVELFAHVVIRHCHAVCAPLLPNGRLVILLIDNDGNVYN